VCVCVCAYSDGCEQALGHVGDDDADEKDDSVEPIIAEYECDDKERDAEEDGDGGDEVDEVRYLACYRCLTVAEP